MPLKTPMNPALKRTCKPPDTASIRLASTGVRTSNGTQPLQIEAHESHRPSGGTQERAQFPEKAPGHGLNTNNRQPSHGDASSVAPPACPRYLRPTNASLLRSGAAPEEINSRTRMRSVIAPALIQKNSTVAFGSTIHTSTVEARRKKADAQVPHSNTRGGTKDIKIAPLSSSRRVSPTRPAPPLRPRPTPATVAKTAQRTPARNGSTTYPVAPKTPTSKSITPTFGAEIGRHARSRNIGGATKRTTAPPPTKLPAPTRQPLRNRTAVPSSSTVRGSVVKQDGLSQPGNVSGRKFIPGMRATSRSVTAREKAPVPVASLPSGKRSASTVQDVVAKSNKEAQADGNIPIDAKEATTPSHQEKSCALHAKIDQDDVAGLVLPTVEAIKPEVALIGGHELAASITQDTTVGQDGQPTSPSSEVDADEGGVPAHDDDRFEVAPEDKHEVAMTLEESVSQPGPSDVDVLSDATALEVDVGKLDSSIAEAQQFKRKHDNEDMTTTPSPSDKHEEVANVPIIPTTSKTESIPEVSFDSPVADNADPCTVPLPTDDDEIDTVDEVPIVCIALPADSPTGLEVISSGTETPASTIYSADVSDFDSGNSQDKQTTSLTEDTEGLATEAGDIPSDLEVPAGEASQARPARLAVSDTILSINGLHEEQVGASIEIVDSAGLPAVDAVHELGQNYWKSIFDVSEDESSFVGGSHTDDSMDEEALEKIREELSRPMPEPPIPKFADWVDPVLAMTAVGVIPKDLGEFSGPHGSEQGPVQPTGVYVPHPVAAALALKDSKTGRMGSGFLGMFMGRTSSASSMSSAASRPSTPPLPPSPPVDTPQLIDGSASPDSPSSPFPRSVSPESIPFPVTPPASDTVTAPAVPRPSKLKSLRRLFGVAN